MLAQQQPTRLPMIRREITEEERLQLEEEIARERESMYARTAIAQFETLSPVEILQRSIDQRRAELSLENRIENMSASSDESQNSNPSTVITSYPRTLPESPFSVEEPESQTEEGETIGTITVTPVPVSYSDAEYTNSTEHPNRTVTITECTESVSTENDNDTSVRTPSQSFPPDDTTSRYACEFFYH